jgi:hypothetical protein
MRDDNTEPRDNQQIQDDNQQSAESVRQGQTSGDARQPTTIGRDQDTPTQAANKEKAEGSRGNGVPVPPRTSGDEGPLD